MLSAKPIRDSKQFRNKPSIGCDTCVKNEGKVKLHSFACFSFPSRGTWLKIEYLFSVRCILFSSESIGYIVVYICGECVFVNYKSRFCV